MIKYIVPKFILVILFLVTITALTILYVSDTVLEQPNQGERIEWDLIGIGYV